jgi:hypothetical protein
MAKRKAMIDRDTILGQMQALSEQRRAAENTIEAIDGAMQLCRSWLGKIDQMEAKAKADAPRLDTVVLT